MDQQTDEVRDASVARKQKQTIKQMGSSERRLGRRMDETLGRQVHRQVDQGQGDGQATNQGLSTGWVDGRSNVWAKMGRSVTEMFNEVDR